MVDELIDRYGEMPNEIYNLLEVARIKCYAKNVGVVSIQQKENSVVVKFDDSAALTSDVVQLLIDNYKRNIFFSATAVPYITLKLQAKTEKEILKEILKLFKIMKG